MAWISVFDAFVVVVISFLLYFPSITIITRFSRILLTILITSYIHLTLFLQLTQIYTLSLIHNSHDIDRAILFVFFGSSFKGGVLSVFFAGIVGDFFARTVFCSYSVIESDYLIIIIVIYSFNFSLMMNCVNWCIWLTIRGFHQLLVMLIQHISSPFIVWRITTRRSCRLIHIPRISRRLFNIQLRQIKNFMQRLLLSILHTCILCIPMFTFLLLLH